ncbi:MAG: energy-coupling factor ABC transporter ATP-binding protein [Rothia sp. (in: high G+C Gram-positive bacteria)]|uniref:energy-coupling factor ABC transporter ATP-binding protein n=1 Tax=Rothia sp. (in: high G+C Gram-positive bacteria) TaxID=1885016 RepID=UPI0026DFC924|nr:energy-coupling factor ABC transporter ATP-binding protein [Rothia sp. (in: high G+C Gram-positive bacteria)]MDO5750710.1 energy-coupling factor ABC transporter ATP-binding protein [Rothia sp. (in: high G+C Gram-positive bacteria)]
MTIRRATGEPGGFNAPAEFSVPSVSGSAGGTIHSGAATRAGLISARNVWVYPEGNRQAPPILSDISVDMSAQSTAILGLNGSGKSTFLGLFNALTFPDYGTIMVHDHNALTSTDALKKYAGMIFSDPAAQLLMPTPVEDIEMSLRRLVLPDGRVLSRAERRERALRILREYGLEHKAHQSVYSLSGGERQLVAFASVLAVEPSVLLLDEPTTLLDARNRSRLISLLESLPQQLVISTHDMDLARSCQQAIIIHSGRIIARGAAPDMVDLYEHYCASSFPGESAPDVSTPNFGQNFTQNTEH